MIEDLLHRTKAGRTTVVIAHRLSSIRNADVIMALDQGQLVERGTHDQLMEKNGLYYRLVTSQEREQENRDGETKGGICATPKWCSSHTSIAMKENEETEDRAFSLPFLFENASSQSSGTSLDRSRLFHFVDLRRYHTGKNL